MKNKKTTLAIIGVIAVVLVTIGITYAYWLVTKTQTGTNTITAGCLDISLNGEANDINLTNQFPLSDEEGMELVPYEFTVTNNCNTAVDYQVNLESIGTESSAIIADALKVAIDETAVMLGNKLEVEPTISGAYASHMLTNGTLQASNENNTNDSATYSLRIWIDVDAPISEMNKTYRGKISVTVGQGINNPIKEGTLAYDIVSKYDNITALSAEWQELEPEKETYNSVVSSNVYYYGTEYEFDKNTGKFKLSGDIVSSTLANCRSGSVKCGEYTLENSYATYQSRTLYKINSFTNNDQKETKNLQYMTTQTIKSQNGFSDSFDKLKDGLHVMADDLGNSYYFRGYETSNYVEFGTYQVDSSIAYYQPEDYPLYYESLSECEAAAGNDYPPIEEEYRECIKKGNIAGEPIMWRIVRINGDGTIRLISTTNFELSPYNSYNNNENDVSYTFLASDSNTGEMVETDSLMKDFLDKWYQNNLEDNYGKYIADGIFCNDKEVSGYTYANEDGEIFYEPGEGLHVITAAYRSSVRIDNKTPKLTCSRQEDKYTVSKKNGNGKLTYPIGLITADEVLMTQPYTTESGYGDGFTMTPYSVGADGSKMYNTYLYSIDCDRDYEYIYEYDMANSYVFPVINLKADVSFTGDGSFNTPYVITTT